MSGGDVRGLWVAFTIWAIGLALTIAGVIGWIMNVYKLITVENEPMRWFIGRIVGTIIPIIGAVLGYF